METVYADSLFLLNAAVDYLVLLSAGKLCALPLRRGRMALGAVWGGVYAVLAAVWPRCVSPAAFKLLAGALMTALAFGINRRTLRAVIAVYAVSAAFGGAVCAVSLLSGQSPGSARFTPVSLRVLLLSFALCYAAVALVFRRTGRRTERSLRLVEVRLGDAGVSFTALLDSGNELCDPISGDRVLIAEAETLAPLLSDSAPLFSPDPLSALSALAAQGLRCRLLPCACVTAPNALLLCFRPDEVWVDGRRTTLLLGVSPNRLAPDGEYQAIISQ